MNTALLRTATSSSQRTVHEVSGTALAAGIVDGNELVASAIPLTFFSNELRYTIDLSSVPRLCHPCYRNDDRTARIAGAEHG